MDVSEFKKLIRGFISDPYSFIKCSHEEKKRFIDWINYEDAEEILKQPEFHLIWRQYNNEYGPGIWIQDNAIQFTRSKLNCFAGWKNFRYENGSGTSDDEDFFNKNKYLKNYWYIPDQAPKLRKFYHPHKKLAVIIQFDPPRATKKRKSMTIRPSNEII